MSKQVKLFAISTCGWCKKVKRFLKDNDIEYECCDVDLLGDAEKNQVREEVAKLNPRKTYPTLVVDDIVIVGYDEDRMREVLDS
ncbi:MAG: glutaredoxin family protein [Deltaproteobacteria bacterium]|nr:glutaredoxin family protein [Deltaproteobacteria bacterium]